jgi:hypothetical protein
MAKEFIFESFRQLKTIDEKIDYLRELATLNHNLNINIENLIKAWEEER